MLYEADEAAWHSTDAVKSTHPDESLVQGYFARKTGAGWEVAYGRLNESGDKFLVAYLATQSSAQDKFTVETFTPPKEDSGFFLSAARARVAALNELGSTPRPYNLATIPAEGGKFYVYLYPAQTKTGVFPIGGDVRYLFSNDGTSILEKHEMHKSILDIDTKNPPKGALKIEFSYHTHVLSDLPEDTDVFHVLTEKPRLPEMIGTQHFIYKVEESGAIRIVDKHDWKK